MLSYVKQIDIFRLDSFFYLKRFLFAENNINKLQTDCLHNLCSSILSFGAYSLNNYVNYKSEGIPFIRGVNMKNGVLDFSDVIYIDECAHKLLWKSEVKPETILLSMSGTIGDVAIAMPYYQYPMNSNQDIAKLRVNKRINVYYLYVFLLSKYGQDYLIREARGSVQQHVFLSQMEKFVIPIFSQSFQLQIEQMVKSAHAKLDESKRLYTEAENQLLDELGLKNWQPKNENINIKTFSESFLSSGRLDAEYYQSKYDELFAKLSNYQCTKLGKIGTFCNGSLISDNFYVAKSNRAYLRIKELSFKEPINDEAVVYISDSFKTQNETIVLENDFIIATIGNTIGKVNIITKKYDGSFISNNTSRFRLNNKNSVFPYYELLLRSPIVQLQIEKEFTQTAQPKISNSSLENIIVPIVSEETQFNIAHIIQKSFVLKKESKSLLEQAKIMVENEIEKGGE